MARYMITHSLLQSWLYTVKENPFEDLTTESDPMDDFLKTLCRESLPQNENILNGIEFENLVTDIVHGCADESHKWFGAAKQIANIIEGGQLQCKSSKHLNVNGMDILLYGRLDVLKCGGIYDIKFSKSYDKGKYYSSTQHPVYKELVPEANFFTYLISNGTDVWTETYRKEEISDIRPTISMFFSWLESMELINLYKEHWTAL